MDQNPGETDPVEAHNEMAEEYIQKFSEPSTFLEKFIELMPEEGEVLDAGCGPGVDASYIVSKGYDVVGVDLAEEMLEKGRENFPEVDFREMDLRDLDFPESKFNGIVASFSLIYLEKSNVPGVIGDFHRLLKDGGLLFLGLQKGESRETMVEDPAAEGKIFMNVMSEEEIKKILAEKGFEIVKKHVRSPESEKEFSFDKLYLVAEARK